MNEVKAAIHKYIPDCRTSETGQREGLALRLLQRKKGSVRFSLMIVGSDIYSRYSRKFSNYNITVNASSI